MADPREVVPGVSNAQKGIIPVFRGPMDAEGLVVGPDGHVLTADSTSEFGVAWTVPEVSRENLPALADELGIGGGGGGVEQVSGTVTLDGTGDPLREFFTTAATTFKANGVDTLISSHTAVVWKRGATGVWGYKQVVDGWTTPEASPDAAAPSWSAALTVGTPTDSTVKVTASALATDDKAVDRYEVSYNGTTWAAIQPGGTTGREFTLSGTAGQTYTGTKLRAVDTAGKVSPALAVPSYTMASAPAQWRTTLADTFDGAQGTALAGRTSTTGAATWASAQGTVTLDGAGAAIFDTHGSSAFHRLPASSVSASARYTVQYDLSAHSTAGSKSLVGVGPLTNAAGTNYLTVTVQSDGALAIVDYAAGVWTISGTTTGHPATGTLLVDFDGTGKTGTVSINGTQVATITGDTAVSVYGVMLRHANSTAKVLDAKMEVYS